MSDFFPEEIIEKILLRLPIKSLIKFTAVCKSWSSLIKTSTFVQSHLCTTIDSNNQNDAHLLLLSAYSYSYESYPAKQSISYEHHWLRWDSPEFGEYSKLSNPFPFFTYENQRRDLRVFGTCNGLVCLESFDPCTRDCSPALIWNPSIRKIVMLPTPPACLTSTEYHNYRKYTSHGFGYDSHSNDYKVLRVVSLSDDHSDLSRFTTVVQVYSLAKGSWKRLGASVVPVDLQAGGSERPDFVNGCLHMLEVRLSVYYDDDHQEHRKCGGDSFIAYFNLATEVFGEIMIPEALRKDECSISRYGESLALIKEKRYNWDDPANCGCDIWVMKEYGVAESWTFLYSIVMVQATIFGFKRCGEVVLEETNVLRLRRMLSLDPKTGQVKVFGTEYCSYYFMDSFVESIVLLDHAKAMSYQGEIKI
ncbi:F-box protein CPR1-like [Rosa rugosa]|uniref:F-box protein CPR1-like n=1 Tax=Rosa rugosa TaxID=74645 RepID=UPI002B409042|nr:F-box protein CPR1-like [Rosa rugosa]